MEAKFLASAFSFLSIFLAIYAQSTVNDDDDSTEFEFETAIYYGDSNVNLGEPFSITCIVPISNPIYWIKDGETIIRHNLRHGRDEHAYVMTESAIEGEKHKIEAHIAARHALKVHEGKYQCNNLHTSYHLLQVRSPPVDPAAEAARTHQKNKSPSANNDAGDADNQLSTESGYRTLNELTPSAADNIFTRTWEPELPEELLAPVLPTHLPPGVHHRQHQHHHQQQHHLQKLQQQKEREKHKFIYINASHFDGSPSRPAASSVDSNERDSGGLLHLEYMPTPTNKYNSNFNNELTTIAWPRSSNTQTATQQQRPRHPAPPEIPPPRFTTAAAPQSPQYYPPLQHAVDHHQQHHNHIPLNSNTANSADPQQSAAPARFPLQTIQTPPNYHQQQHRPQHPATTITNHQGLVYQTLPPLNPFQQYNQMQTYPPALPPPHHYVTAVLPAATSSASYAYAPFSPVAYSPPTQTATPPTSTSRAMLHPKAIKPSRKEPEFLVPNYDNEEHQLKVYEIRTPLVLSCNITKEGNYVLTWEKNGTDVSKVKELEGRHRIIALERKFIIDRTDLHDDGLYSCVADNQKRDINVVARVVVRTPSNSGVVEGEKLSIVCTVVGTDPQLTWMIHGNLTIANTTDRYILKPDDNHIQNAILSIENVSLDDRGEFKCIGRNAANEYANYGEANDASYVRVKGKLAALWPFLGICAEVLILCTIILIYEKRRNKTELEESDTDPQEHCRGTHATHILCAVCVKCKSRKLHKRGA